MASDATILRQIRSSDPHDRASAASSLLLNHGQIAMQDLLVALQSEAVPRIRTSLNAVLEKKQAEASQSSDPYTSEPKRPMAVARPSHINFDMAALIRHELSGPIGWVRMAAFKEIADYRDSATELAVRKLQRKIDGLVSIARIDSEMQLKRVRLSELLVANWPLGAQGPEFSPKIDKCDIEIDTDIGLFSTLISNVYQNAIEASAADEDDQPVQIYWGRSSGEYWVRVFNRFIGERIEMSDVMTVCASSKRDHQGQGIELIQILAERLKLNIFLSGASGVASFTLTGERVDG